MPELSDIATDQLDAALQAGMMRLQVYVLGGAHEILLGVADAASTALTDAAKPDGTLDGMGLSIAQGRIQAAWRTAMEDYQLLFAGARRQAVALPFGMLSVMHERFMVAGIAALEESAPLSEAVGVGAAPFFEEQLAGVLEAANNRIYGDGLRLSRRLWNLDNGGWEGIQQAIYAGIARGDSAWNIAKDVEQYLGAGAECPRWTRARLYGLSKQEVADGDRRGLYSGEDCAGQGVAYNALRLARTELQYVHHAADDLVRAKMPWIEKERVRLSPEHPEIGCACEDAVVGGENNDGVYPKGEIVLPLHPHCLCWKEAIMLEEAAFVERLRGWYRGGEPWAEMDDYAGWVMPAPDTGVSPFLQGLETAVQLWLWGSEDDLDAAIAEAA